MVGAAIKKSGIPRSELFITTKLWNNSHAPSDVEPALDASLKALGMDYVDLYLMHWPSAFKSGDNKFPKDANGKVEMGNTLYLDRWKVMEKLVKTSKTKAIGVSNFSKAEIELLLQKGSIVPAAHQIECHVCISRSNLFPILSEIMSSETQFYSKMDASITGTYLKTHETPPRTLFLPL
jgi:alcohol dehydrogenase (NADP+)